MDDLDLSSIMVPAAPVAEPTIPQMNLPPAKEAPAPKEIPEAKPGDEPVDGVPSLLIKIRLFFDVFPAKLKDIKPRKALEKLSEEELRELERKISYVLGAKTNVEVMAKSFPMALKTVEDLLASVTPLRIQGTHRVCADPEVQDLVKYCIIDSGLAGINSTPQQRLAFTFLTTALQQHVMNTAIESMSTEQKAALAAAMNRQSQPPKPEGQAPTDQKSQQGKPPADPEDKYSDL